MQQKIPVWAGITNKTGFLTNDPVRSISLLTGQVIYGLILLDFQVNVFQIFNKHGCLYDINL